MTDKERAQWLMLRKVFLYLLQSASPAELEAWQTALKLVDFYYSRAEGD